MDVIRFLEVDSLSHELDERSCAYASEHLPLVVHRNGVLHVYVRHPPPFLTFKQVYRASFHPLSRLLPHLYLHLHPYLDLHPHLDLHPRASQFHAISSLSQQKDHVLQFHQIHDQHPQSDVVGLLLPQDDNLESQVSLRALLPFLASLRAASCVDAAMCRGPCDALTSFGASDDVYVYAVSITWSSQTAQYHLKPAHDALGGVHVQSHQNGLSYHWARNWPNDHGPLQSPS